MRGHGALQRHWIVVLVQNPQLCTSRNHWTEANALALLGIPRKSEEALHCALMKFVWIQGYGTLKRQRNKLRALDHSSLVAV